MVFIGRVTEASTLPINGWVTTDYGTFPILFDLPIQRYNMPGTVILNAYFDVGMLYQVMAYSEISGKSYNLTELLYGGGFEGRCGDMSPITSIMISDGFQFSNFPGGYTWVPTYANSQGIYESGFVQIGDFIDGPVQPYINYPQYNVYDYPQ